MDYKIFSARNIPPAEVRFLFKHPINRNATPLPEKNLAFLDSVFSLTPIVTLLLIHNDTILYEKYFKGYDSSSMAKSITSSQVSIALHKGLIKNVQDPITNYLPESKNGQGFEGIYAK